MSTPRRLGTERTCRDVIASEMIQLNTVTPARLARLFYDARVETRTCPVCCCRYFGASSAYVCIFYDIPYYVMCPLHLMRCFCFAFNSSPLLAHRIACPAGAAHPNKTAPFLWACGTDERLPRHFQSPT